MQASDQTLAVVSYYPDQSKTSDPTLTAVSYYPHCCKTHPVAEELESSEDSETSTTLTSSGCSCAKLDRLESMMGSHTFLPYTEAEAEVIANVVRRLVLNEENRYPRFGGLCLVFLRSPVHLDIINWVDSLPLTELDEKALLAYWCSTDVDVHDAVGIFGTMDPALGKKGCLALGVVLKADLRRLFRDIDLDIVDRNRTGLTSAMYVANFTDAVVLKVSEQRKITLFSKHGSRSLEAETVEVGCLRARLCSLLGRPLVKNACLPMTSHGLQGLGK